MSDVKKVVQVIKSGKGLTKDGTPKVSTLEKALGRDLTSADRDDLVKQAKEFIKNGGKAPEQKTVAAVRRSIVTSGTGGW